MQIIILSKIKSKTNDGFAARIIVRRLIEGNTSVIVIEKKFLSKNMPINIGYIKKGSIYYCVQTMSFKEETLNQIIESIKQQ